MHHFPPPTCTAQHTPRDQQTHTDHTPRDQQTHTHTYHTHRDQQAHTDHTHRDQQTHTHTYHTHRDQQTHTDHTPRDQQTHTDHTHRDQQTDLICSSNKATYYIIALFIILLFYYSTRWRPPTNGSSPHVISTALMYIVTMYAHYDKTWCNLQHWRYIAFHADTLIILFRYFAPLPRTK